MFRFGFAVAALLLGSLAACGQKSSSTKTAPQPDAPAPVVSTARSSAPAEKALTPSRPAATRPKATAPPPALESAPPGGVLHIDSDVPGAQVFIDRQYLGVTPLTAPNVSPGAHRLNVSAPGYDGIVESVDVEPGSRELRFNFKEVRLDAVVHVVHKHRLGSCEGRLIATPQGIRYETTDQNDAFSSPLAGLERFDIDYMAKTLHVKPATGKQYDFTDPEGNADRLFVFHRDVDAARKKLERKP
jgi:hypothetical protein